MKRSDIDDERVITLARAWKADSSRPGVLAALVAEGVPTKVALSKIEHMTDRGLLEYGVSAAYAWPTQFHTGPS